MDLLEWREALAPILQNTLLDEGALINFARDRGIRVFGVVTGDPGRFLRLGWLAADDETDAERPRFHPFRILQLYRLIQGCDLHIAPSASVEREHFHRFLQDAADGLPSLDDIGAHGRRAAEIVDLAVLLEPLYWPVVTSQTTWRGGQEYEEYEQLVEVHRVRALELIRQLDANEWKAKHERLRWLAAELDPNGDLYMLLRLAPWSKREHLKGRVSGGMWFRHMAEVLRRGFEEALAVSWPEEDQDFGHWFPGARSRLYGSDRPLDAPLAAKPYVAFEFGLHTGSVVRWYLEGETEFHATATVIPGAATGGIELINLKGAIAGDNPQVALRVAELLEQDRQLRRFSFMTFDTDVAANTRFVRRQIENGNLIGYVAAHTPDFELANFSVPELAQVAARLDESQGASGDPLREHHWPTVTTAKQFETEYCRMSQRRPRGLKGDDWGRALANYALEYPDRDDTQQRRPFMAAVDAAIRAIGVRYDDHRDDWRVDPQSFTLLRRAEK